MLFRSKTAIHFLFINFVSEGSNKRTVQKPQWKLKTEARACKVRLINMLGFFSKHICIIYWTQGRVCPHTQGKLENLEMLIAIEGKSF
jgi:hypothetical protein